MEETRAYTEVDQSENHKSPSNIRRLATSLWSPGSVFETIRTAPNWFLPFFVSTIMVIIFSFSTNKYRLEDMKTELRRSTDLSVQEAQRRIDNIERQQRAGLSDISIPHAVLGIAVVACKQAAILFGMAFALWLALQLFPTKISFNAVLSVCSYALLVLIPESLLMIPLVIWRGTMRTYFGLASLLPDSMAGSTIHRLAVELNLFSIWMLVLIVIGLTVTTGLSKKKVAATVTALWTGWIIMTSLFGGLVQIA